MNIGLIIATIALCGVLPCAAAGAADATPPSPVVRPAARGALQSICVFSRETMFATSNISTASNRRLQQLRDEAQAEADRDRQALDADTKSFQDGQAGLSPALLKQLQDRLAERARDVGGKIGLRSRELERTRQQVTAQIEEAAGPIVREMERLNGCSLLLTRESVIDAPGMIDITSVVIATMNTRLQPSAFQRLSLNNTNDGGLTR